MYVLHYLNLLVYHQNQSFLYIISILFAEFVCANFVAKFSVVNLLNSGVVIYLLWSFILFSTGVKAVVIARLVMLGFLFLTSFILAVKAGVLANLVILGIPFLTSLILALRLVLVFSISISFIYNIFDHSIMHIFFNNIVFTISLSLLKSAGAGTYLSTSNLSTLLFKLLKLLATFLNLSIPNLSASDFKLVKSVVFSKIQCIDTCCIF